MEKIIEIKSNDYIAKINVSRGANLISLKNTKYNANILREPDYDNLDNPYLYGMPLLFPVNRISGGEFLFEGRTYKFPINEENTNCHIHGFLHDKEFEIAEQSDGFLKCSCDFKETKDFPHSFRVVCEYKIDDEGIEQKVTFENLSGKNMPCILGFHTTFNVPFVNGSKCENVFVKCEVADLIERGENFLPTGNVIKNDDVTKSLCDGVFKTFKNPISRHYVADGEKKIVLFDEEKKLSLVYETDKKFCYRLVYNGEGTEFICLEPQNCAVDAINSVLDEKYKDIDIVEPHSKKEYISKLYIKQ